MKYAIHLLIGMAALVALASPARAESLHCPDLAQARQIASCPAESELRDLFDNRCNDDHYASPGLCIDYAAFRRAKNIALWESADGEFTGNRSCDPTLASPTRPKGISVDQRGTLTILRCEYGAGVVFSLRTRKVCRVEGAGDCAGGVCSVRCE